MTASSTRRWLPWLVAVGVAAGFALILQGFEGLDVAGGHGTAVAATPEPVEPTADTASKLEKLSCFGCHNIEHYKKGKPKPVPQPKEVTLAADDSATADDDEAELAATATATDAEDEDGEEEADEASVEDAEFSHTLHDEEVGGHCHVCHAFTGHFQVTIRKATCDGCH